MHIVTSSKAVLPAVFVYACAIDIVLYVAQFAHVRRFTIDDCLHFFILLLLSENENVIILLNVFKLSWSLSDFE